VRKLCTAAASKKKTDCTVFAYTLLTVGYKDASVTRDECSRSTP